MEYNCEILSLNYTFFVVLKYHQRYIGKISQQSCIPITTGAPGSQNILTSSSWLLKKEFKVVKFLLSILAQTP